MCLLSGRRSRLALRWVCPTNQSEVAVWLLAKLGLLVFVAGQVIKMAQNNDDEPWGRRQLLSALMMALLIIGLLIATSGWLYK